LWNRGVRSGAEKPIPLRLGRVLSSKYNGYIETFKPTIRILNVILK